MQKKALILFIKNPILGTAKTRLAATIGEEAALEVYLELLSHTRKITQDLSVEKYLYYNRFIEENDVWPATLYNKKVQSGGDLGQKMMQAFQEVFDQGHEQVLIIGSDCGELQSDVIETAFQQLDTHDLVIGPAKDGGYYLLGMKTLHKALFENKQWSTEGLFKQTIQQVNRMKLTHHSLKVLNDVDEYDDLMEWRASLQKDL